MVAMRTPRRLRSRVENFDRALGVEAELTVKVRRRRITQTLTDTGEGS